MTQSLFATILDGATSKKGALLLVPAILLVGATLAIGKNSGDAAKPGGDAVALLTSTGQGRRKHRPAALHSATAAQGPSRPSSRTIC
jgi:hypothetical protein